MGYQLAQKLKYLKKKMQDWKNEVVGDLRERKNQLLVDIQRIDAKAETENLDEDRDRRTSLK